MKFVAYIDRVGTGPPPPKQAPGTPTVIEVDADIRLEEAIARALKAGGVRRGRGQFWPNFLRDADEPNSEIVPFPRVGIGVDGEFIWTEGARDRVTLSDLERARQAGFFHGDPRGVFLEKPMYGDGVIPGWEDFFKWILEFTFLGGLGAFVGLLKSKYKRWQARGASSPFAFLDIVVARDEWKRRDLSQLLGLSKKEATELLKTMGFEQSVGKPRRWRPSSDPNTSALRRRIIEDYLHRSIDDAGEKPSDSDE